MQKTLFRIMETYSFRVYSSLTEWISDIDHPQGSNVTSHIKVKETIFVLLLFKKMFDLSSNKKAY